MKRFAASILVAGVAVIMLASCSLGSASVGAQACSQKVAQELLTDKTVKGVWNCLSPDLQNAVVTLGAPKDDTLFTDGTGKTAVQSYHFVSETNGVDIYVAVVKDSNTGKYITVTVTIYYDTSGKVTNIGISGPRF